MHKWKYIYPSINQFELFVLVIKDCQKKDVPSIFWQWICVWSLRWAFSWSDPKLTMWLWPCCLRWWTRQGLKVFLLWCPRFQKRLANQSRCFPFCVPFSQWVYSLWCTWQLLWCRRVLLFWEFDRYCRFHARKEFC